MTQSRVIVRNGVRNHELLVSEVLRAVTEEIGNKVSPILPVVGFVLKLCAAQTKCWIQVGVIHSRITSSFT